MAVFHRRIIWVLLAAAAVYLAGNARVSLFDRDEPRYAQCSRQMLQSGDWVVPRLYDEIRAQKPPLIYWCQATVMKLIGDGPTSGTFAARFPSSLAMLMTLTILAIVISRHVGPERALWTVLILSTSLMAVVSAKVCLTDSVLLLFTTVAQLCLYAIWRGNRGWLPVILMAVMLGWGGLTKGPFIVGTVACTAVVLGVFQIVAMIRSPRRRMACEFEPVLSGSEPRKGYPAKGQALFDNFGEVQGTLDKAARVWALRSVQILVGLCIIVAIVAPWLLLVHHRAPEFLGKATAEAKAHLETGKEGHNMPPGYHFVLIWVTFFPWSFLLPLVIGLAIRHRREPEIRFALAAVIGPWLMIEFMGTKLPHYVLSIFPALSFITATGILRCLKRQEPDMEQRSFQIGAGCWAVATIIIAIVPWLLAPAVHVPGIHPPKFDQPYGALWAFTLAGVAYAAIVFLLVRRRRFAGALATMGAGMMTMILIAFTLYLPNARFLRTSAHVARVLSKVGATEGGSVVMVDYKEPSLGFYQGGTIREEKSKFLLPKYWSQWPRWMVVTREAWEKAPPESKARLRKLADPDLPFRGWSYADGGRVVELSVVENVAGTGK